MSQHYISHNMFDMLVFSWFCVLRLKNVHFSVLATLCCKKKYPCKMKVTCVTWDAHKQFPRMPLNQKSVTMSCIYRSTPQFFNSFELSWTCAIITTLPLICKLEIRNNKWQKSPLGRPVKKILLWTFFTFIILSIIWILYICSRS